MKLTQRLFILIFLCFTNSYGQNFGAYGAEWFYSEHGEGTAPLHSEYLHSKSVLDTIIEGKTTHKITQTTYKFDGSSVIHNPIYVYEEADTVFRYNFSLSSFTSLYIFNGEIGDTLLLDKPDTLEWTAETYRLVIDTITETILDGVPIKKYKTTALDDYSFHNGGYFMDLVGGLDWFTPRAVIFPEEGGPIRCHVSPIVDTSFWDLPCDYRAVSAIEANNSNEINVYPNPFSDFTNIDLGGQARGNQQIKICNLLGEEIYNYQTNGEHLIKISAEDLKPGVYFIFILETGTSKEMYSQRLIVN